MEPVPCLSCLLCGGLCGKEDLSDKEIQHTDLTLFDFHFKFLIRTLTDTDLKSLLRSFFHITIPQ